MRDLTNLTIEAEELDKSFGHNLKDVLFRAHRIPMLEEPPQRREHPCPPHPFRGALPEVQGGQTLPHPSLELPNILGFFGFLIDNA